MNLARDGPCGSHAVHHNECSKLSTVPTLFDETTDVQLGIEM